jgi:peptidyl-prolyl isomerase E (cyclophilin E)
MRFSDLLKDNSELYGRTLRVNLAKALRARENSSRPVWADDDWLTTYAGKHTIDQQELQQIQLQQKIDKESAKPETDAAAGKRPAETAAAEGQVG